VLDPWKAVVAPWNEVLDPWKPVVAPWNAVLDPWNPEDWKGWVEEEGVAPWNPEVGKAEEEEPWNPLKSACEGPLSMEMRSATGAAETGVFFSVTGGELVSALELPLDFVCFLVVVFATFASRCMNSFLSYFDLMNCSSA
jgi:hypothetical protein